MVSTINLNNNSPKIHNHPTTCSSTHIHCNKRYYSVCDHTLLSRIGLHFIDKNKSNKQMNKKRHENETEVSVLRDRCNENRKKL